MGAGGRGGGGLDLAKLWQQRRFRYLLNLIDHLPSYSFLAEAQAQDDEVYALVADDVEAAGPYRPRVSQFGMVEELLSVIADRLGALGANFVIANSDPKKSGKPKAPKPLPRPETAADRARSQRRMADVIDIVTRMTPGQADRIR